MNTSVEFRRVCPKSYSNAPFVVAAFLLAGLQLILGRTRIVGETFVNNDDLMRATQVRDLLNGQAWWDLHQYRLGVGPELAMHWTRHVDALAPRNRASLASVPW